MYVTVTLAHKQYNKRMNSKQTKKVSVVGAGSWGTALALLLARNGHDVRLWGREKDLMATMVQSRCNERYLPQFNFPNNLTPVPELSDAVQGAEQIVVSVSSVGFYQQLQELITMIPQSVGIICASKGLEPTKKIFFHEAIQQLNINADRFAVVAGPSFAKEVAAGLPTAVILASESNALLDKLIPFFHNPSFRVYESNDVLGAEIGGILKNVYAISAGISDGLGFGANARCALITRALAEMLRFGIAMGAKQETLIGLSGMGDLVLTCTDDQSRNRRFGLALAKGLSVQDALTSIGQVVEGQQNAQFVLDLATKHKLEMPIVKSVSKVLADELSAKEAVEELLAREPKREF